MERPQAWRVGRGDVDGQIVRRRRQQFGRCRVVGRRVGAVLVLADVDPDEPGSARPAPAFQGRPGRLRPPVVEAEPVDHRAVLGQAEDARARIARLGARRHGADLDEAESQGEQRSRHLSVLVEAGRHADGIGEVAPPDRDGEARVVRPSRARRQAAAERPDRRPVRGFRIEQPQTALR